MAQWKPNPSDKVASGESLGRRLFEQPRLIGAAGQKKPTSHFDLRNFEENRGVGVSLDRLGRTNPESYVLKYLGQRAHAAASKFRPAKQFHGWATIQAKKLHEYKKANVTFEIVPSPLTGEGLEENLYHADAHCSGENHPYSIALHLRELFQTQGSFEQSQTGEVEIPKTGPVRGYILRFSDMLMRLAEKFR